MNSDGNAIRGEIDRWREKRRAVILAHNYQPGIIQDLADHTGDSLDLARRAAASRAEVIVFCGVHFMAETAAILAPGKTVLLPEISAGCPMANMVTAADVRRVKAGHPDATVVSYVNTTAGVKAETDYCCTSANAVRLVASLPPGEILFFPDQNLGDYVRSRTGREMVIWPGYCPTHMAFLTAEIEALRARRPGAVFLAHPECRRDIRALADHVLSTGGMIRWVAENNPPAVIVGTENGIIHRLKKENPRIEYIPGSARAVCPNMKKITLEKVLASLRDLEPAVAVEAETADRARRSLERMIAA